jgi:hypothetical protein
MGQNVSLAAVKASSAARAMRSNHIDLNPSTGFLVAADVA